MQRTRLFKSLAIVAAAGLAFAACGDDDKDSATTDGAGAAKLCDATKGHYTSAVALNDGGN